MAPYPEEIDVFSLPHTRMKELVDVYREKLLYTDFKDYAAVESLLHSLHHTFCEFKSHEQIENKYIMRKLKKRLKLLSIHDATVCNCHSDNKLSDMLALVKDGYSCTSKPEAERINFGIKLQDALQDFTCSFLPHMKEEEEVFQPMLMKYFGYEELKCLKEQVIKEHSKWYTYDILNEKSSPIVRLPHEVILHIMSYLNPKDVIRCSQVSRSWNEIAWDSSLWKDIYPCFWAHGTWENYEEDHEDCNEKFYAREEDEHHRREVRVLEKILNHLVPQIGAGVQKIVLSSSRGLTNNLLQSFLILCPNISHLDISYTDVSDSVFKGLKEYSCCLNLQHLNMSGCKNVTDLGLFWLADCMAVLPPDLPDGSHHLREIYLRDCLQANNNCCCEIEETASCLKIDFCSSSCCWQRDGFMCHLAKLSLNCPYYMQQPGASSVRKTTATFFTSSSQKRRRETKSLKFLSISGCCEITDEGLRCLFEAGVLKMLEFLDVSGCWLLTGPGLCSLTSALTFLKPENLFYCDQIVDGPHPDTSNGCQNLETGVRACCRQLP
uniref:Putative f-box and leucine-rich repeat protein 5 n=1 Tax=Parasteatoda tepidariorum TaxID=114398 RepID=A0A2L2XX96_PARTP